MSMQGEQILLRIYLQSADRPPFAPTFERIVRAARHEKLAGATVLTGVLGAGYHGLIRGKPLSLTQHQPVIVEIVDSGPKFVGFIQGPLKQIMVGGMMTLERAAVILYRHRSPEPNGLLQTAVTCRPCPRCLVFNRVIL